MKRECKSERKVGEHLMPKITGEEEDPYSYTRQNSTMANIALLPLFLLLCSIISLLSPLSNLTKFGQPIQKLLSIDLQTDGEQ